jgi:hypothetical protein
MASRVTIYGSPAHPDVRRLRREMNVMSVEYALADPRRDERAARRLRAELGGEAIALPLVEVQRADGQGSVYLTNPDEPTLRQSLYSEDILSITSYWL